jgi:hypothetical protein
MSQTEYTLAFVLALMHRLAQVHSATWLCGGWAEELRGLCAPRHHQDGDLFRTFA